MLFEIHFGFVTFAILSFVYIFMATALLYLFMVNKHKSNRSNFIKGLIMLTAIMGFIMGYQIFEYSKYNKIYKNKEYLTVEGEVECFSPMPKKRSKHVDESFEINGVHFSYRDDTATYAYHKTYYKGGVIRGNGQKLRINYVTEGESNWILSIEEIK